MPLPFAPPQASTKADWPHSPTTRQEWDDGIRAVTEELGIAGSVSYSVSVFLEAAR